MCLARRVAATVLDLLRTAFLHRVRRSSPRACSMRAERLKPEPATTFAMRWLCCLTIAAFFSHRAPGRPTERNHGAADESACARLPHVQGSSSSSTEETVNFHRASRYNRLTRQPYDCRDLVDIMMPTPLIPQERLQRGHLIQTTHNTRATLVRRRPVHCCGCSAGGAQRQGLGDAECSIGVMTLAFVMLVDGVGDGGGSSRKDSLEHRESRRQDGLCGSPAAMLDLVEVKVRLT